MENSHGRLVLVVEKVLSDTSRQRLRTLLEDMWGQDDVTWVSGLSHASILQAQYEGGSRFYNHKDFISADQVMGLMPWREVWLVADGRVWKLAEA